MPTAVDLALIATPAVTVPGVVKECAEAGVKGAVILSAGFTECGPEGRKLEEAILSSRGKDAFAWTELPWGDGSGARFKCHFSKKIALPGNVAFISQSGALCTSVLDWSLARESRIQRIHVDGFDDRCRLGRLDLLPGGRSEHSQHSHLHGVDRKRAIVPFCGTGSRSEESRLLSSR